VSVSPPDDRELEAQLQRLFRAARHDHEPSAADRAAVERALLQRLGAEMLSTTATASPRSPWLQGPQAWLVATALVLAGVTGWLQLQRAPAPAQALPNPPAQEAPEHADTPAPDVTKPQALVPAAPVGAPSNTSSKRRPPAARARVPGAAVVDAEAARVQASEPSRLAAAPPNAATDLRSLSSNAALPAQPKPDTTVVAKAEPVTPKLAGLAPSSADRKPEQSELAFMRLVHAALNKTEYGRVLELCAEHARRWPHGAFEPEREGVRALVACALHLPDSERSARAYFTRFAQSPLTPRVRATCNLPVHANPSPSDQRIR
jgi:hypothetical protein